MKLRIVQTFDDHELIMHGFIETECTPEEVQAGWDHFEEAEMGTIADYVGFLVADQSDGVVLAKLIVDDVIDVVIGEGNPDSKAEAKSIVGRLKAANKLMCGLSAG